MSVTIKDVAAHAGVSFKTVSNVVNGRKIVKEETRKKVQQSIQDLGYRPNFFAKSLANNRSNMLGFVIMQPPESAYEDPFIAQITIGMHEVINQEGYGLLVKAYHPSPDKSVIKIDEIFDAGQVDALVMVTVPQHISEDFTSKKSSIPLISLDEGDLHWEIPVVYIDNYEGGFIATQHLLNVGRQRIGIVLPTPLDRRPSLRRTEGYRAALTAYGVDPDESLIIETEFTLESLYDQTLQLLKQKNRPDALFVADDKRVLAVYEAIRSMHLRIPEDIAIVGFGDWMVGRYLSPSLTSIHHPFREMGQVAARKAIQMVNEDSSVPESILMPTHLVVRESCGAPLALR
jgi:LacI family transcriptional regulator, repressor for deo operon, udp, cdd, tsx, nupC, and nupG